MAENPNCQRTWATFRLGGTLLDPDEISTRLGIQPSHAHKRGDQRGHKGTWPKGIWTLTSEDQVQSTDLQQHIEWLLDQLEPVQPTIDMLVTGQHLEADVFCFWESATGQGGPMFSANFLERFARLHVDLGLDIYFVGSDETESLP